MLDAILHCGADLCDSDYAPKNQMFSPKTSSFPLTEWLTRSLAAAAWQSTFLVGVAHQKGQAEQSKTPMTFPTSSGLSDWVMSSKIATDKSPKLRARGFQIFWESLKTIQSVQILNRMVDPIDFSKGSTESCAICACLTFRQMCKKAFITETEKQNAFESIGTWIFQSFRYKNLYGLGGIEWTWRAQPDEWFRNSCSAKSLGHGFEDEYERIGHSHEVQLSLLLKHIHCAFCPSNLIWNLSWLMYNYSVALVTHSSSSLTWTKLLMLKSLHNARTPQSEIR